jgi:dolichol-phosphate mannosyltransferase
MAKGQVDPRGLSRGDDVVVIVPTYDERPNLAALVGQVVDVLPLAHVLIVDDASPDGTGEVADSLASRNSRVSVMHRSGKLGLGTAYVDGFRWGLERGFRAFVEMDADFSHAPGDLPRLLEALDAGADLAVGSRYVLGGGTVGWGPHRHLLSRGATLYARAVLGAPVHDMTSGFKAYTRAAIERIDPSSLRSNGYAFQIETTYRALKQGLRVDEVPIAFVDRRVGASKMSRRIIVEGVSVVWRLRFEAAFRAGV